MKISKQLLPHRILEERCTHELTESEISEYAGFLGMHLPEDSEFLWIAREGLKAPLPRNWKPCQSESGDIFYFNFDNGESCWDHPLDSHFRHVLVKHKRINAENKELHQRLIELTKEKNHLNDTIADLINTVKFLQLENQRLHEVAAISSTKTATPRSAVSQTSPVRGYSTSKAGNSGANLLRKELREIKNVLIQAVNAVRTQPFTGFSSKSPPVPTGASAPAVSALQHHDQ